LFYCPLDKNEQNSQILVNEGIYICRRQGDKSKNPETNTPICPFWRPVVHLFPDFIEKSGL